MDKQPKNVFPQCLYSTHLSTCLVTTHIAIVIVVELSPSSFLLYQMNHFANLEGALREQRR